MLKRVICLCAIVLLASCSSVILKPVDFSWSFESVLTTDSDGYIKGEPKTIACNVKGLFFEETKDSMDVTNRIVRVIRDREGYYYLTSPNFKNVYIFEPDDGILKLEKKVLISENGMEKPVFNRRDKGIELLYDDKSVLLNKNGLNAEK